MALAPHWLDDVFENAQDPDELLQTLINSPEMQEVAKKAFSAGERQRKAYEHNTELVGPSVSQAIRSDFLMRLNTDAREDALALA